MSNTAITTEVEQLLSGKNFASFATLMKDGSPHVAPTWVDYDGELVLINTAAGRIKEKNVTSDKRVALSVYESSNPYNMVTIRGNVKEITEQDADSHIDKLAKKYLGLDSYPFRNADEKRIILKIVPERVFHQKPPS
ncbi:PPOX class F420-dependent oxidoreductase [Nitrosopumilus sp.]|uniref:PPOX class F420-dependent oxidoreductase n=1 Tax=Nitrosopumilus sp. TaxID=2024843 RepID=UPI002930C55B|nr:PPOX class F420-dependent oxidoreductase [Nitrosopumilus sp.]